MGPLLGPSWAFLGPSWGHLGPSWGHLGAILGHLGAILGPSWAILGPSCPEQVDFQRPHPGLAECAQRWNPAAAPCGCPQCQITLGRNLRFASRRVKTAPRIPPGRRQALPDDCHSGLLRPLKSAEDALRSALLPASCLHLACILPFACDVVVTLS